MICGTFTLTSVPDDQLAQTMQGYRDNDPPPVSVTAHQEDDGTNTVVATFPPCTQQTSHNPGVQNGGAPAGTVAASPSGSKNQLAKQTYDLLTANHAWSPAQACGIIANIEAESSFKIDAIGDGGTAYGLCQWHVDRQMNFRSHFGHDIHAATYQEQVQFITYEMKEGSETRAGARLTSVTTPEEAGIVVSLYYERPDDPKGSVSRYRGDRAVAWFGILATA